MKPHPFLALAVWAAFWVVYLAPQESGDETTGAAAVALIVIPQLLLGVFGGRWWIALVPLAIGVWFTVWASNHPSSGLSEISGVPLLFGMFASATVVGGVAFARLVQRSDRV